MAATDRIAFSDKEAKATCHSTPGKSSGVTRVGVTRGNNWWVSPYFFLKNFDDLFWVIASESGDLFSYRPLTTPIFSQSRVVYPVFFLNSATENNFRSGVTSLEGATRGGPPPPSIVTPMGKI